ncbi:MAG: YihY/virulence factor BrkB family protein [Chitinophagaceae bacterium]|nr:MAG: YihY/virulence factor BrkB family protein [Chitinophagaceae bacterium]
MNKIFDKIRKRRVVRILSYITKKFSFPGFEGVPIYNVLNFFSKEIKRDVIHIRAKAIAFSFFLAIVPSLIFVFSLIPYLPVPMLQDYLIEIVSEFIPNETFIMIEDTVTDVIANQRGGLLSLGFLIAVFFATNGMSTMMDSFDKSNASFVNRKFLKSKWIALKLTIILIFLFIATFVFVVTGNYFLNFLLNSMQIFNQLNFILFSILKWVIVICMFFISISIIYYYGPSVRKRWRFISAGSTLATILCLLISLGFSYYVNNFGHYNVFYGSLGTIIVFLLWLYLNSLSMILGFELNASIAYNRLMIDEKTKETPSEEV